jgi:RimJ/RimL family protein N-acetyltransferase
MAAVRGAESERDEHDDRVQASWGFHVKQSAGGQPGLPVGQPLPTWTPRSRPPETPMTGRFCRLERLDAGRHGTDLYDAFALDTAGTMWTYLASGPFADEAACQAWLASIETATDPMFFAYIDLATAKPVGIGSLMRISPADGVIEVGWLTYSPRLQRTPVSTEAMYLLMARVFDEFGYRRYEWKCNALNAPSRATAERLGFTYEGTFRQATIAKGHNRDTAWYSIIDSEWPALKRAFSGWLAPANFDASGRQHQRLADLITRERG